MGDLKAQGIANTAWAFATANRFDALLFAIFACAVERFVVEFSAQNLANTLWAVATAGRADAPLFAASAGAAESGPGDRRNAIT